MEIKKLSVKMIVLIALLLNAIISFAFSVYYYNSFLDVLLGTIVCISLINLATILGIVVMNLGDALFLWVATKFKKGKE